MDRQIDAPEPLSPVLSCALGAARDHRPLILRHATGSEHLAYTLRTHRSLVVPVSVSAIELLDALRAVVGPDGIVGWVTGRTDTVPSGAVAIDPLAVLEEYAIDDVVGDADRPVGIVVDADALNDFGHPADRFAILDEAGAGQYVVRRGPGAGHR